jgi:hypothetical protein
MRSDGSRMSMHNLGCNQSEKARKEIEDELGLVKAQRKELNENFKIVPVSAQKVAAGKSSVKRAISNVLGLVINQYKYTSLPELNAVLQLYSVITERGEKGSVMYDVGGLVYRVLDEKGNKISPPLKASSFYMKPTLKNLQEKFIVNDKLRQPYEKRLRTAIDYALLKKPGAGLKQFINDLNREKINVVLRQNKEGIIYGITYVDLRTKCVFNGSDLGKPYSAKLIQERTGISKGEVATLLAGEKKNKQQVETISSAPASPLLPQKVELELPQLMPSAEKTFDFVPYQLKKKRKKKKRKQFKL